RLRPALRADGGDRARAPRPRDARAVGLGPPPGDDPRGPLPRRPRPGALRAGASDDRGLAVHRLRRHALRARREGRRGRAHRPGRREAITRVRVPRGGVVTALPLVAPVGRTPEERAARAKALRVALGPPGGW